MRALLLILASVAAAAGAWAAETASPAPATASALEPDPVAQAREMLEAVAQAEIEVRDSLRRFDRWLAEGRARFSDEQGAPDWRWSLLERIVGRVHSLLDPEELSRARQEAGERLEHGDAAAARERLAATMRPFMDHGEEAATLMNYVPRRVAAQLGLARLQALLRGNGIDSPAMPRLAQLEALLAAREARDDFAMAAEVELAELESLQRQAYDAAFQSALGAARARPAQSLRFQSRDVRCPLAADTGAPGEVPRLDTTLSAPTYDYYPGEALDQDIEGKVALSARIDPQGCVRAAAVLVSSGVEMLDAAALRWMLEGAVYTRSRPRPDGQPAVTALSVNFQAAER
ncbi:MAG: TonB family protein [Sinobacteraceae bacterium]|nr:TonB family protein [Nevskiaceae bacterium]MCP5466328.1 TonB family protein [Nevskiaceae bacterium]